MEIRVYFEGHRMLRTGFERFFSDLQGLAGRKGSKIQFVAAKDGPSSYRKARRAHPDAWNILLKDSEKEMPERPSDLCKQHGIDAVSEQDVFWMVQLMEAWFLADPKALAVYYEKGFSAKAIGTTVDVEIVPKSEVLERLKRATEDTTKGEYHKVNHAPFLLERLDPNLVRQRAQHCRKLFEAVEARLKQ
jgi:hypothetical protein